MSDAARFFVDAIPSHAGASLELPTAEAHHAMHVLRLPVGELVELFDGRGCVAAARIVQARKGNVAVALDGLPQTLERPTPVVHLAFAVPKGKRLDWLLEKVTELGAASLTPVIFARSVAGGEELSENKRDRWLTHCVSAAKQSGLNFLPELREPQPLAAYLAAHAAGGALGIVGDLSVSAQRLAPALASRRPAQPIAILVGPEGGITDAELAAAKAAGFAGILLGKTVLRVETAAVALLAATLAVAE